MARKGRKLLTDPRTGDPGLLKQARNIIFGGISYGLDTFDPDIRALRSADRFNRASARQQARYTRPASVWRSDGRMRRKQVRRVRRKYGRNLKEKLFG